MIKAVIFDLDGVIVSTDNLHYQAWKKLADRENIYFDERINHHLRGISRMHSLDIILKETDKEYTEEEKLEMATFKNDIYVESLSALGPKDVIQGIPWLLRRLKKMSIKVAIGSSSKNAKNILTRLNIIKEFDAISDGTNITHSKPHPQVFMMAADMLGLEYKDCAVIEDAVSGIEAANACNMLSFAVGDAKKSSEKDHDFEDLIKVLTEINL